jgi:subtilisin family serine protease
MSFRRIIFIAAIFAFLISSSALAGSLTNGPDTPAIPNMLGYVPNKIVVKFNPDLVSRMSKGLFSSGKMGLSEMDAIGGKHGARFIKPQFPGARKKMLQGRVVDLSGWHEIHFTGKADVEDVVKEYKSLPGVIDAQPVSIHPVYTMPNDQYYYLQWHLPQIQAPQAWDIETGNASIVVAILDTGVRYFMGDLGGLATSYSAPTQANGNMWINWAEKTGGTGDDDGNGFIDDWIGWDFVESTDVDPLLLPCFLGEDCDTADNDPRDFNGHGTHCAGSVGAMNNNWEAVASVSGGWGRGTLETTGNGVKVMPLRIGWSADLLGLGLYELGLVEMSYAAQALFYAADNGARIASCSWGSANTGGIHEAIDYFLASGGLIFKAAGNDGTDSPDDYISGLSGGLYERIIKVAATDENDCKADFSNFGNWVTLSAPGVGIYSSYHDHYDPVNDYVASMDGTSMAAPLAASVAALIWSKNPALSADEVKNRLVSSADPIDVLSCNSAYAGRLGAGRINAYNAVSATPAYIPGDFAPGDCDVDGSDLAALIANTSLLDLATFTPNFGKNACP